MLKGTAGDWLRLVNKAIKMEEHGKASDCPFCQFVGKELFDNTYECKKCILYLLTDDNCGVDGLEINVDGDYDDVFDLEIARPLLCEIRIVLEDYIRRNR